jgi:hypothetical protein
VRSKAGDTTTTVQVPRPAVSRSFIHLFYAADDNGLFDKYASRFERSISGSAMPNSLETEEIYVLLSAYNFAGFTILFELPIGKRFCRRSPS